MLFYFIKKNMKVASMTKYIKFEGQILKTTLSKLKIIKQTNSRQSLLFKTRLFYYFTVRTLKLTFMMFGILFQKEGSDH